MVFKDAKARDVWNFVVMVATVFASIEIPLRLATGYRVYGAMLVVDWLITALFAFDIYLQFTTPIVRGARTITDRRQIARHYMKGWFIIDLLATIPFDLLIPGGAPFSTRLVRTLRLLRLTRVLRVMRLYAVMRRWLHSFSVNPAVVRMLFFMFWVLMGTHWIACGWLGMRDGGDESYMLSLYWAITTLTTVGYGDVTPHNDQQMLYSMVVMYLGVGVYAFAIGNIANILRSADMSRAHHVRRIDAVRRFMVERDVPDDIQERVRAYYSYLWETKMGQEEATVLGDLPPSLRAEIALFLNRRIVERVPLFADAPPEFAQALVSRMSHAMFTPGDPILHKGEAGDEMYFINRGRVEVMAPDEEEVVAILSDGDYFGEMSLLYSTTRAASVNSVDYTDVYVVDRGTFERVLNRFPQLGEKIKETAALRMLELEESEHDDPILAAASATGKPVVEG
jgi:voltage-gated potassium channel